MDQGVDIDCIDLEEEDILAEEGEEDTVHMGVALHTVQEEDIHHLGVLHNLLVEEVQEVLHTVQVEEEAHRHVPEEVLDNKTYYSNMCSKYVSKKVNSLSLKPSK